MKMTEEQLKALLDNHIEDSLSHYEDVDRDVQKATDYYLGKPFGNEVSGKSSVVDRSVAASIDGALPQLLKIFTQSVDVVEFTPQNDGDQVVADNVTQYVNHIFNKDNAGAILMHNWFWDSLVNKCGILKAFWDVREDVNEEEYQGLSQDELGMLMAADDVEITEQEEIPGQPIPVGQDPMTGEPLVQQAPSTYNVKI